MTVTETAPPRRTLLSNGLALEEIVRPEEGLISRRIFTSREVYELELERIFARSWFFLGHDSEIPEPGDWISRPVGIDGGILVRDGEGVVRAFLNSCRHRGMRVCRTDSGNNTFLRCPDRGWVYRNDGRLANAAVESHYCPGELEKEKLGLISVAQVDSVHGLWFATWDSAAPALDE